MRSLKRQDVMANTYLVHRHSVRWPITPFSSGFMPKILNLQESENNKKLDKDNT